MKNNANMTIASTAPVTAITTFAFFSFKSFLKFIFLVIFTPVGKARPYEECE